jgi:uncharacterized protein (TIGR02598 family)
VKLSHKSAFSLVEIALALGVISICFLAIYGLLPIALASQRAATNQSIAAYIVSAVYSDMKSASAGTPSSQFKITDGTDSVLYFDAYGDVTVTPNEQVYRLTITFSNAGGSPVRVHLLLTSPADSAPSTATSSYQVAAAFKRD